MEHTKRKVTLQIGSFIDNNYFTMKEELFRFFYFKG
jgi:hypothetical protein